MNRRWGMLSALLMTALLLYCMPGLLRQQLGNTSRTHEQLRPPPSRTMTVWVTSWLEEDHRLITSLCAAFEKQRPGLRLYLRRVDAQELTAPDAVLPDVVLHVTGDVSAPEKALLPMSLPAVLPAETAASGYSAGQLYALPLWFCRQVFSVPRAWFAGEAAQQPGSTQPEGQAFFALHTPAPQAAEQPIGFDTMPWRQLLQQGCVVSESGVGLMQLLLHCPIGVREELSGLEPAIRKPMAGEAAVCSLATHAARGEEAVALALLPAAGQKARYLSVCKNGEDARAFAAFLLDAKAQGAAAEAWLAPIITAEDTLQEPAGAIEKSCFLPNAFWMDQPSIQQVCLQGFGEGSDPVAVLLGLR